MNFRFTSAALHELSEALNYYENAENGLGGEFLDEVEGALARILAAPEAWRMLSRRTRRCRTHRFPFGIIYQIRPDEILVVAVMDRVARASRGWVAASRCHELPASLKIRKPTVNSRHQKKVRRSATLRPTAATAVLPGSPPTLRSVTFRKRGLEAPAYVAKRQLFQSKNRAPIF
jgi:hypothetical protein